MIEEPIDEGLANATPPEWFVAFKTTSRLRFGRWIPGRFKHVLAFAALPHLRAWVFVEFCWAGGSAVAVVSDDDADLFLGRAAQDAVVLKLKPGTAGWPRWGMWCVPATAHVLGVKSCALWPDGFFRDCLRHGGEIVLAGDDDGGHGDDDLWRRDASRKGTEEARQAAEAGSGYGAPGEDNRHSG